MACYMSAEEERVIEWKPPNLLNYVPPPAQALSRREFGRCRGVGRRELWRVGLGAGGLQRRPVTLGVQSYSFRDRSLDDGDCRHAEARPAGAASCGRTTSSREGVSREEKRKLARDRRRSITSIAFAISSPRRRLRSRPTTSAFSDDFSDAEIERGFEMAAALGAPLITSSSNIKTVARVAPVAARRKMLVGDAQSFADRSERVRHREEPDRRACRRIRFIAVNLDIGHFTAANEDAVAFLKQHHARIVTLHLKDRKRDQGENVPFGAGRRADRRGPQAAAATTAGRSPPTSNTNTRAAIRWTRWASASTIAARPWAYNPPP